MTPIGCAVGRPITGQLNLECIPVLGLVATGASVTCMGFLVWWQYHTQWGILKPFEGVGHGAHGKPLQVAGKTQHLNLQWGEARGRASFIVIIGLESDPVLIGMDIMRLLLVLIDVTNSTAIPAALCYFKPSTSLLRQHAWSVAITHGPERTSTFDLRKASLCLCPEYPRLPVDPKCGSQSTTTAPSRSACTPNKLWAH